MDLNNEFEITSYEPCDQNLFPAACFRFLDKTIQYIGKKKISQPCESFDDRYYQIGCVWGVSFGDRDKDRKSYENIKDYCNVYHVDFIDDFLNPIYRRVNTINNQNKNFTFDDHDDHLRFLNR